MVERDPLLIFSMYLSGRVNVLVSTAEEILENLDCAFTADSLDMQKFERADLLIWFWTLGAYEVVRTMCQADVCFSPQIFSDLKSLKKVLGEVRMPAAKMERPGKKQPLSSNRSPSGWDISSKDILVCGADLGSYKSGRLILAEFDRVFCSISARDILQTHEESYEKGHNKALEAP